MFAIYALHFRWDPLDVEWQQGYPRLGSLHRRFHMSMGHHLPICETIRRHPTNDCAKHSKSSIYCRLPQYCGRGCPSLVSSNDL